MALFATVSQKRAFILSVLILVLAATSSVLGDAQSLRERILNKMSQLEANSSEETGAVLAQIQARDATMSDTDDGAAMLQLSEVDQSKVQTASNLEAGEVVNIQMDAKAESEVDEDQEHIQVDFEEFLSHDDTFLQLASKGKMSFDCWSKTQYNCESQYCVWTNNRCTISPSAYSTLCGFYCEPSICVVPANSTELSTEGEEPCVPTAESFSGLCTAIKSKETCALQGDLCTTTAKGQCVDSCCSRAKAYCKKSPKKQATLNNAMLACGSYTSKEDICEFSKQHCGATAAKKP